MVTIQRLWKSWKFTNFVILPIFGQFWCGPPWSNFRISTFQLFKATIQTYESYQPARQLKKHHSCEFLAVAKLVVVKMQPWKKLQLQTQLSLWRSKFQKVSNTWLNSSNNFLNMYILRFWGFCTSYILKWSFKSCHFRKNHVQKWHTWWRHKVVMTSFQQLLTYPNAHTNRLSSRPGVGSCPISSFGRDIRAPKWYV